MKKILFILFVLFTLVAFCVPAYNKGFEFILYKDFLQELIDNVFPISFSETYTPDLPIPGVNEALSFDYKIIIHKPDLSIYPQYIQINNTIDWTSSLGKQSFPGKCRFMPIFNTKKNQIEFKVIEGKFNLKVDINNSVLDFGYIDISEYISNIKIPLEFNKINVSGNIIKPRCKNVIFRLLEDKIILSSEVAIKKE